MTIIKKTLLSLAIASLVQGCGEGSESTTSALNPIASNAYTCSIATAAQTNTLTTYQIMVESFVDGDDTIGHGTGYGTSHHNGDLQGIIDSLDYIQSLGVNAIWLTPIFHSEAIAGQEHWADRLDATGYFATDYFTIDPRFGDLETARELVEQAHARGLYVFFDGVFGHHKDGLIQPSPSGLLPSGSSNPVDYPESLAFYQEVASYWIKELKIDGWRLDQAYQVPTEAWAEIRKTVDQASQSVTYVNQMGEQVNPLGYMVAEIWSGEDSIAEDGYGSEDNPALCSAFDFPMRYRVVETLAVNESGVGGREADWLDNGFQTHAKYPSHAQPNLMIGNHDLVRFGDLLQRGDIAEPSDAEYWLRHKSAFAFQAAYTGPITIYYGDEIGDQVDNFADQVSNDTCAIAGLCDDHVARSSAKIEGVTGDVLSPQQADLKNYVSELLTLRQQNSALFEGERINLVKSGVHYVDLKQADDNQVVVAMNIGDSDTTVSFLPSELGDHQSLLDLQTNEAFTIASDGRYAIPLSPFGSRFLKVQ